MSTAIAMKHRKNSPIATVPTEKERVAAALEDVPVVASLPPRVRAAVVDRAVVLALKRGGVVFWQGNPGRYLTVVLEGFVKGIVNSPGGREVVADIMGPGSTPCWPAALHDGVMPLTLTALQDTRVARLPITPIRHCISSDSRVALAYATMLSDQHQRLTDQVLETRAASVPSRLGGLLCHLLDHLGDRRTGWIPIRLTRQDLADAAGTTVETAIRLMRKWEKLGILETHREGVRVLDRAKLRDLADGASV